MLLITERIVDHIIQFCLVLKVPQWLEIKRWCLRTKWK